MSSIQVASISQPHTEICGTCEKPGATIKCIGNCQKHYHQACVDIMAVKIPAIIEEGNDTSKNLITC